jgi:hypothetical protein
MSDARAASDLFTYSGLNSRGEARSGAIGADSAVFVEERFNAGWRRLQVMRDGVCIGIIGRRGGRRAWWAETAARPEEEMS